MAITPAEIKQLIVEEDDFGHELRVGKILIDVGAQRQNDPWNSARVEPPSHGGTYIDPNMGKPRQFDYRCRIIRRDIRHGDCGLLAVECKNLHPSSPLVICGRARTEEEAYHTFIESRVNGQSGNIFFTKKARGQSLYREGEFVGKSLMRMKEKNGKLVGENNSDIYEKWSQALASSIELANLARFCPEDMNERFRSLVLPIVVLPDGVLWKADYDDNASLSGEPQQVDQCEFYVGRRIGLDGQAFVLTHVHFTTLTGLPKLLSRFWKPHSWDRIFPPGAEAMEKEFA